MSSKDFSVPTCIGVIASITITAASLALRDDMTSPVKSKYPGVSNKLNLKLPYSTGTNPNVYVILTLSFCFDILFLRFEV